MKKGIILFIIISLCSPHIFADEIILKDNTKKKGEIIQITTNYIEYNPIGSVPFARIELDKVKAIKYYDRIITVNPDIFGLKRKDIIDNSSTNELRDGGILAPVFKLKDDIKGYFFEEPLRLSYNSLSGKTKVKMYDENDTVGEGDARLRQQRFLFSYEKVKTKLYFTPEIGYFYRTVTVKDFSYDTAAVNESNPNFVGGVISDPASGQEIPKDEVSSLSYTATFHSIFLDAKLGGSLSISFGFVDFFTSAYFSMNVVDYKKSEFVFKIGDDEETFSEPFTFGYFSAYGFGAELGGYIPYIRTGFSFGVDRRIINKFDIPEGIQFKQAYYDDSTGIHRTKERQTNKSSIDSVLFTVSIFTFI